MLAKVLGAVFSVGPLLFGLGFLAPVVWQALEALGWAGIGPVTPLAAGLGVGAAWGGVAQATGRWV